MQKRRKILFLTLQVFSATGGIEKVCRIVGKVLYESKGTNVQIFSMYDNGKVTDIRYFPASVFKGFSVKKFKFIYCSIKEGLKNDIIILSHINLLPVGYLIKLFSPKTQLVLFVHGIEVWKKLSRLKIKMINNCDCILAVSNFTKGKLQTTNSISDKKCIVLNNCIDPFLPENTNNNKPFFRKKYGFTDDNFILITVTRIAADEQYKGHDKVIESIGSIFKEYPFIRYLIVGKYELSEKIRLDNLIAQHNLQHAVVFTGFVADEDLPNYYTMANVFVMPSYGEGFGIAFIEAMYYNLPVIAGNQDGSIDALSNGELGILVNPHDQKEIAAAIKTVINKSNLQPDINLLMQKFSFNVYKEKMEAVLKNLILN